MFADGQAQAAATYFAAAGQVGSVKAFKNAKQMFIGYAGSIVAYLY
jgi:hypothetical protein